MLVTTGYRRQQPVLQLLPVPDRITLLPKMSTITGLADRLLRTQLTQGIAGLRVHPAGQIIIIVRLQIVVAEFQVALIQAEIRQVLAGNQAVERMLIPEPVQVPAIREGTALKITGDQEMCT